MSNAAKMMEVALDRIVSLSQDKAKAIARLEYQQQNGKNLTELLSKEQDAHKETQKRLALSLEENRVIAQQKTNILQSLDNHKVTKHHLNELNDTLSQQLAEQKNNYELLDAARQDQINDLLKQREEKNAALRQIRELVDRTYGEHYGPTLKQINQILVAAGLERQPKKPSHTSLEGGLSG